ncbi:MAG: hypothetical protein V3T84_02180, partial [Phycisphaerales bacterium]
LGRATIIVREDQLSLAIGRRGQNVRLAARLTGWDIDILTPAEFAKSLETLEQTVRPIEGVNEEMLDRMGALGMISVFDIEEVGPAVLEEELAMPAQVAQTVVETCAAQAKIVAEQQQKEKEEAATRKAEEEATAATLLGTGDALAGPGLDADARAEAAAASILGGPPHPPIVETQPEDSDSTETSEVPATEAPNTSRESGERAPNEEPATPEASSDEPLQSTEPAPQVTPFASDEAASAQPAGGTGD